MNSVLHSSISFMCICLMAATVSCGLKGDPVAPRSPVPRAIEDLTVFSRAGQVVLRWSIPQKDTDGLDLGALAGFRVWRRVITDEDGDCPSCPKTFDLVADIDYLNLPAHQKEQRVLTYWDDGEKKNVRYRYAVSSYTVQDRGSAKSNAVPVTWDSPPPAPGCLKAETGDRSVTLAWECGNAPDSEDVAGFAGFNVYRRSGSDIFTIAPLNAGPLRESRYRDLGVSNGAAYVYVVRALRQSDDMLIESRNSPEARAIPQDRTPPAPPTISMVYKTDEGVVVVWEPSGEADVAGYYVYRRIVGSDTPEKISESVISGPPFIDTAFTPGRVYYYSVTAVDRAAQENESGFSQELRVETGGGEGSER